MVNLLLLALIFIFLWILYAAEKKPDGARASVSSRELAGLWRQTAAEPFVGYLYFTGGGAVYYMASRLPVTEAMFTDRFKIADSCSGHAFSVWEYAARRERDGRLLLAVSGRAIGGIYQKVH